MKMRTKNEIGLWMFVVFVIMAVSSCTGGGVESESSTVSDDGGTNGSGETDSEVTETFNISGTITFDGPGSPGIEGVTVTLTPAAGDATSTATDASGQFSFTGVSAGTLTASLASRTLSPASYEITGSADTSISSSIKEATAVTDRNFVASIDGWTNISNAGITGRLTGICFSDDMYLLAGDGGNAYFGSDLTTIDSGRLTNPAVTGAGDFIGCELNRGDSNNGNTDAHLFTSSHEFHWYPNDPSLAGAPDEDRDFSAFTTSAGYLLVINGNGGKEAILITTSGGLYFNEDFYGEKEIYDFATAAEQFDPTNRAPSGANLTSIWGGFDTDSGEYTFVVGGEGGKLFSYTGENFPGSGDWVSFPTDTTENITGVMLLNTEQGTLAAAIITESGSLHYLADVNTTSWVVKFSGLPYNLYDFSITDEDGAEITIVGSSGLILRGNLFE